MVGAKLAQQAWIDEDNFLATELNETNHNFVPRRGKEPEREEVVKFNNQKTPNNERTI